MSAAFDGAAWWAVAGLGHVAICVTLFNRVAALGGHWARALEALSLALLAAPAALLLGVRLGSAVSGDVFGGDVFSEDASWRPEALPGGVAIARGLRVYWWCCAAALAAKALAWSVDRRIAAAGRRRLTAHSTRVVSLWSSRHDCLAGAGTLAGWLPGNQILELHVERKQVLLPELPAALEGWTITHLSDLHCCGHLTEHFFLRLVEAANAFESEVIVLTGDLVDRRECLDWIDTALARLSAPRGVYYVLGNHDRSAAPEGELRGRLEGAGLIALGSRTAELNVRGSRLLLAGNELPWHGAAPIIPPIASAASDSAASDSAASDSAASDSAASDSAASASDSAASGGFGLKLLASHSPDPFLWARRQGYDLMLAGHTHGGQIRFPLIGPVVSPSRFGGRYASGLFVAPGPSDRTTVMHVSRGVSGLQPLRWNCPPEITQLVLSSSAESLIAD